MEKIFIPDINQNISEKDINTFLKKPLIEALDILKQANNKNYLKSFTRQIIRDLENTKDAILLIKFLNQINKTSLLFILEEKQFIKISIFLALTSLFLIKTLETYKKDSYIPLNVALAITRQESAFEISAISRAGARGLMQLMPRTARITAKKINHKYIRKKFNV